MYVPRFGETNIVYDKISGNNILTTKTDKTYGTITIQDGILTHSNEKSNFNSPTGILYGSATNDIWSLESTKITDGIFTRSNNTLVFNNPNGLLYGSTEGKWSLNNVNDPTPYEDDKDYVLYYGKDANNANKVTPYWRLLRINGKNFITDNTVIQNQWNNIVVDPTTCNIISIQTERLEQQDYGLYNHNGKVVKLSPKVLNDIGFKIFHHLKSMKQVMLQQML